MNATLTPHFNVTPAGVIQAIHGALFNDFLTAALIVGVAVLVFVVFFIAVFVTVYAITFVWAGLENKFRMGDEEAFEYDEQEVIDAVVPQISQLYFSALELLDIGVTAIASAVSSIVQNWQFFAIFLLTFTLFFVWDAWHHVLLEAVAEAYTCFIAPVVRTLVLPPINIVSFALQTVLPVTNALRHLINSITIEIILRAISCGFEAVRDIFLLVSLAFSQIIFALVAWITTAGAPGVPFLDVGPNFVNGTATIGQAIGRLDGVFTCACQPLGEIVVQPIFEPFRSPAFANALNATLALVPVFLTQGLARPIVRSIQNAQAAPNASFFDVISVPSFNSTFDTATRILNQTGAVGALFNGAVFEIVVNIINRARSTCPSVAPPPNATWSAVSSCGRDALTGAGFCAGAVCQLNVVDVTTGLTSLQACATPTLPSPCTAGVPPTTQCACAECFCTYTLVRAGGNFTNERALGACRAGTNATLCEVTLPNLADVEPPEWDIWAGLLGLVDAAIIQPMRYLYNLLFNIIFNPLGVFSRDGYLFWRYEYGIARFNEAIDALIADLDWLARIVQAVGELIASTVDPAGFAFIDQHPAVRIALPATSGDSYYQASVALVHRAQLHGTFQVVGDAIRLAADFISQVIVTPGNVFRAIVIFGERLLFDEGLDTIIGTAYFTVTTAIDTPSHIPNPFAYGQLRWGDNATANLTYSCGFVDGNGTFVRAFDASLLRNVTPAETPCTDFAELSSFCRFAFQQVLAGTPNATSTLALSLVPAYILVQPNSTVASPLVDATINSCLVNNTDCTAVIRLLPNAAAANASLTTNEYNVTLERGVDIFRQLDPLLGLFLPSVRAVQGFFSGVVQPFVPILLVPIDTIVHLDKLFTSGYIACIDFEAAIRGLNDFIENFTDILRAISEAITSPACAPGNGARDSRILCVVAQFIDGVVDLVVETIVQLVRFFQLLVRVINGRLPISAVASGLTFEATFAAIGDIVFTIIAVFAQIVPIDVRCATLVPVAPFGCCNSQVNFFRCVNNITLADCQAQGGNVTQFVLATPCSLAFPGNCSAATSSLPVQQVLATTVASIVTEFTLLIPRIPLDIIQTIITTLTGPAPATVFGNVINAIARPSFNAISNAFRQLANLLHCASADSFASALRTIADVIDQVVDIGLELIDDLLLFVIYFVFGIVEIVALGTFTLFDEAIQLVFAIIGQIILAIFGPSLVCDFQTGLCDIATILPGINDDDVNLFVIPCRRFGCIDQGNPFFYEGKCDLCSDGSPSAITCQDCDARSRACTRISGNSTASCTPAPNAIICCMRPAGFMAVTICTPGVVASVCEANGRGLAGGSNDCVASFGDRCTTIETKKRNVQWPRASNLPGEAFCGAFLATFGIERASTARVAESLKRQERHSNNTGAIDEASTEAVAAQCYQQLRGGAWAGARTDDDDNGDRTRKRGVAQTRIDERFEARQALHTSSAAELLYDALQRTTGPLLRAKANAVGYWQQLGREGRENFAGPRAFGARAPRDYRFATLLKQARTQPATRGVAVREIFAARAITREHTRAFAAAPDRPKLTIDGGGGGNGDVGGVAQLRMARQAFAAGAQQRVNPKIEFSDHQLRRAVWKDHAPEIMRQTLVDTMTAFAQFNYAIAERGEHTIAAQHVTQWFNPMHHFAHGRSNQAAFAHVNAPLSQWQKLVVGLRIVSHELQAIGRDLSSTASAQLREFVGMFATGYDPVKKTMIRTTPVDVVAMERHRAHAMAALRATPFVQQYDLRFRERTRVSRKLIASGNFSILQVVNAGQALSNDTLDSLGLFVCDPATAVLCSGCAIVDNGISAAVDAGLGLRDYYTNNDTGFLRQLAVYEFNVRTTLLDTLGEDTYTTVNKTTRFIGDRLHNIQWPWRWNYTEFIAIITSSNSTTVTGEGPTDVEDFVGRTESEQERRAAEAGRPDIDNDVWDFIEFIAQPVLTALERVVGAVRNSRTVRTLAHLYEVYVACDYRGSLACNSPRAIGLFDALIVGIVAYVLVAALLTLFLPGTQAVANMALMMIAYFVILWMAYGASPLCTIPSFFSGIMGVPACLPVDASVLVHEFFPQCPFVPVTLIDPAVLAEASTTLCATCGTAPVLRNCAEVARFLNGLDNLFYLTGTELSPGANERIAQLTELLLPQVAAVARLYTPEYIASLGQAGRDCFAITLPSLFIAFVVLQFQIARIAAILGTVVIFVLSMFWTLSTALLAANAMLLQMEKGFVHGTLVRKLQLFKTKTD